MSNWAMTHNIDAFIGAATASDSVTVQAGVTGNNTAQNGLVIDRAALSSPLSASFALRYKAALGAGNTLSVSAQVLTSAAANMAGATVLATFPAAVADTGQAGGSTQRGIVRFPVDFAGAQEFVQLVFTPNLSAASEDTAELPAVAILGGQDFLPA